MQDLINTVTEKTGLSEEMASQAVEAVMSFMKDKLPESIGDNLEGMLSGEGETDVASSLMGIGKSFFGK